MIQRRAIAAGIATRTSCHSFRATDITTYLQNGGKLEVAQQLAGHESARTTGEMMPWSWMRRSPSSIESFLRPLQ
jgi:site-specific recombinase XerD